LTFDAGVVRQRPRDDRERRIVPDKRFPERGLCERRNDEATGEKGDGERILRVREPSIGAAVEHDTPLVPGALLVLIENAAGDDEALVAVAPLGYKLNRRGVVRQIGDMADLPEIDIRPHDD